MSMVLLEDISLESDDLVGEAGLFDSTRELPESPLYTQNFNDMDLVFNAFHAIKTRGCVCRDDIEKIKHLADQYPTLKTFLQKYPSGSYTQDPSSINYEVSTEGFISTAYNAVIKVLRDILTFIINSFKRMWEFLTGSERRTVAVDALASKVQAMQDYLVATDKALSGGPVEAEYRKAHTAAFAQALNGVNKSWREIHTFFFNQPHDRDSLLEVITGILKTKIPPFIDAVDEFLKELAAAETEADVKAAVDKMKFFDLNSGALIKMAAGFGFSKSMVSVNGDISHFQSQAGYVASYLKSMRSRYATLTAPRFTELVVTMTVDDWSKAILETIKWSSQRTGPVLERLNNFSDSSLKPGLEEAYSKQLIPFFKVITSSVAGFNELENSLSALVDARNEATLNIAKGGLVAAKLIDKFALENKSKINVSANSYISKYRDGLRKEFV